MRRWKINLNFLLMRQEVRHGKRFSMYLQLFAQLGLPSSEAAIERFIAEHSLPNDRELADAEFWTPAKPSSYAAGNRMRLGRRDRSLNSSLHH